MRIWLLSILLLGSSLAANAQSRFANEWVKYNQRYIKVSVAQAGIYRLSYQDIKNADASFLATNPVNWQLFFRGQEISMRVVGQQDGLFDAQDYVEFYGEGNDGSQDSLLYRPKKRLHPYQTLYSDTTAYFLTSSTLAGKRVVELNTSAQGLTPEKFHVEETVQAFTSDYTFNNLKGIEPFLQQSYFEPGEGWSGTNLTLDSVGVVQLKLTGRVVNDWPIKLDGMVNGRDNLPHSVQVQVGPAATIPLSFLGFASQTFQQTITASALQNEQLTLRFTPAKTGYATNNFSITYAKLTYPQALDMTGKLTKTFHILPNPGLAALLSVTNAPASSLAYDITDKANCRYLVTQTTAAQTQIVVSQADRNRTIFVSSQLAKPVSIKAVRFSSTFPKTTDYLILTHASLRQSAATYAAYRASDQGGHYTPFIVEPDSLYDQFNYGEKSPLALRRFADYMLTNTGVKYMLLVGRACSYPYYIKNTKDDLVPTIGYPGSDILLTAGLGNYSTNSPAIPTGRLNVTTNDQVLAYLEKVKQLETPALNGLWRKHILHISGGNGKDQAQSLRSALVDAGKIFTNGLLGGQITSFNKTIEAEVQNINISPQINDGVSMITFFGHAGPGVTDMNFGFASPPENGFHNQNKYPLMIFNGCGAGEIFSRFNTLSTDWLLAPQKGAGIVLAHSYWSFEQPTTLYLTKLYTDLFVDASTLGMSLGRVQQRLNQDFDKGAADAYVESVMLEMILQGDPALSVYPLPNPDFSVSQKGIYLQSSVVGSAIKSSDSIQVVIPMTNLGKFVSGQSISLSLKKTLANATSTTSTVLNFGSFRYQDTLTFTIAKDLNLQKIDILIDPDNKIVELSKTNNSATLTIDWAQVQGSSYPAAALPDAISPTITVFVNGTIKENKATVDANPHLEIYLLDQNALSAKDTSAVDVYLKSCVTCTPQKLSAKTFEISSTSDNQLRIATNLSLKSGSTYQLVIFGKDATGNRTLSPYTLDLTVLGNDEPITLRAYPNPATTYAKFELTLNVQELPVECRLMVYNLAGMRVYEDVFSISTGKNSLLWQGASPGIYLYSLLLTWKEGRTETYKGKVLWQN
ncbi:putative type IX secretion system sortase PorU2 [Spirosoma jeollabukense]